MYTSGSTATIRSPKTAYAYDPVYQLAFELKTDQKGDGVGASDAAIDKAVAQVLRSTSGLINHLSKNLKALEVSQGVVTIIPAVFTTAELWTSDVDLSDAELQSGNLPLESGGLKRKEWIWFSHNRSPALEPDTDIDTRVRTINRSRFSDDLRRMFARTVAIVSSNGIDSFLTWNIEEWLE